MTDHCNLPEGFAADAAIRIDTEVGSISEGMQLLFKADDSNLKSLGENGLALVKERFTWTQIAEQMNQLYQWILVNGDEGEKPDFIQ